MTSTRLLVLQMPLGSHCQPAFTAPSGLEQKVHAFMQTLVSGHEYQRSHNAGKHIHYTRQLLEGLDDSLMIIL